MIGTALSEIRAGESYEVCLTNMASVDETIDAQQAFEYLRSINPTPYSALLDFTGISVVSASPERFLRVDSDGNVESKPIKGPVRAASPERVMLPYGRTCSTARRTAPRT